MFTLALVMMVVLATKLESVVFYKGLVNNKARGISKLAGALEKRVTTLEVINNGTESVNFYIAVVPSHSLDQLAYISGSTEKGFRLKSSEILVSSDDSSWMELAEGHKFYKIYLEKPLEPQKKTKLKITVGYINMLKPLPKEIRQTDNQFSVYEGSKYFFSPYTTAKQSTRFTLASKNIKSFTETTPYSVEDNKIKYGPVGNVPPFSSKLVRIHFMNNEPILRATTVIRDYEVSHWGNVRVTETYNLLNAGARLKEPYQAQSSYKHMNGWAIPEPSAVRMLNAILPPNARRVTFSDRLGNITTSQLKKGRKRSILYVGFRYPLFGGWKTDFEIAYDAPAHDFLRVGKNDEGQFVFNASFSGPFKTPVAEVMTTKIALPEGAYDIRLELPYEVDSSYIEPRFTYLDSSIFGGRPVQVFVKHRVVELHTEHFQVYYRYDSKTIWFKPLLMCATIFVLLLTIIFLKRIDISMERRTVKDKK